MTLLLERKVLSLETYSLTIYRPGHEVVQVSCTFMDLADVKDCFSWSQFEILGLVGGELII